MPKLKIKKTLLKRIKISKSGKFIRRQIGIGHLKRKMDSSRKTRKSKSIQQFNIKVVRNLKRMLAR